MNASDGILTLPYFDDLAESKVHWTHDYQSGTSSFYDWNEKISGVFTRGNPWVPTVTRTNAAYKLVELNVFPYNLKFGKGENGLYYYAAAGNPFMSSIRFSELLNSSDPANKELSANYWVWTGSEYAIYSATLKKILDSFADDYLSDVIPPMQSFIVENQGVSPLSTITFDSKDISATGQNETAVSNENRFLIRLSSSNVTGIESATQSKIWVYNSQANTIQAVSGELIQQMSVFNIQGQKIYEKASVNAYEHSVNGLAPGGIYGESCE